MAVLDSGLSFCINAVLVLLCVLFLAERGCSINCWECNSKYDPNCGEPFKNHTIALTDCNQRFLSHHPEVPGKICRKIVQKVRDETRIIRSCGYLEEGGGAGKCITRAGTYQVFMQYCHCDNANGCNAAERLFASARGSFSSSLFAFLVCVVVSRV